MLQREFKRKSLKLAINPVKLQRKTLPQKKKKKRHRKEGFKNKFAAKDNKLTTPLHLAAAKCLANALKLQQQHVHNLCYCRLL